MAPTPSTTTTTSAGLLLLLAVALPALAQGVEVLRNGSNFVIQLESGGTVLARRGETWERDLIADVATLVDLESAGAAVDVKLQGVDVKLDGKASLTMLGSLKDNLTQAIALSATKAELSSLNTTLMDTKADVAMLDRTKASIGQLNAVASSKLEINEFQGFARDVNESIKSMLQDIAAVQQCCSASSKISSIENTLGVQGTMLANLTNTVDQLLCSQGVGVDECGVCKGDSTSCCPGHHLYGSGNQGSYAVTGTVNGLPQSSHVRIQPPAAGQTALTTTSGNMPAAAGDTVLVISMQSASTSDYADVGNFEFATVASVSGSRLTLTKGLKKRYTGSSASNQRVFLHTVPEFDSLTISGQLRPSRSFDGNSGGGVIVFMAKRLTMASSASISADSTGFSGGSGSSSGYCRYGYNGQGINRISEAHEGGANVGGGAGGRRDNSWCINRALTHAPMGGGGGSHRLAGGLGQSNPTAAVAYGSTPFGKIFLGGGGGGASSYRHSSGSGYGGAGGTGGGLVIILAQTITISGSVPPFLARGQQGRNRVTHGGSGGGGAGGSIMVQCDSITRETSLFNVAGGGTGAFYAGARGGTGSDGRVSLQVYNQFRLCKDGQPCTAYPNLAAYCNSLP